MRKICKKQLPLPEKAPVHPKLQELEKISTILDQNSSINDLVAQDLVLVSTIDETEQGGYFQIKLTC
jgi:hypothetical protein